MAKTRQAGQAVDEPKRTNGKPARGAGLSTNIFIPAALNQRLARYMLDKYAGRAHMRNVVICEMLDAMLAKEGY